MDRKCVRRGIARLNGRGLSAPPMRNAETVKNHPRGVGSIESVKVNAGHSVIQKIMTLLQGELNADAPDYFRIVFASLKSTQNLGREPCATGQFRDPFESAHRGNRHDPSDNGNVDSGERTTFAEIEQVAISEE